MSCISDFHEKNRNKFPALGGLSSGEKKILNYAVLTLFPESLKIHGFFHKMRI
jgi:hypothetical protein